MVHILAPKPADPVLPAFFNVDGVVGAPPAENRLEDVLFIQFCLRYAADHPGGTSNPQTLEIFRAVQPTGGCDAATINAIHRAQEGFHRHNPAMVVDGRVSPAHGYYFSRSGMWAIININVILRNQTRADWPRLDKLPGCPPALANAVIRELVGAE